MAGNGQHKATASKQRQLRSRLPALSHQLLLCAGRGRPTAEFLNELTGLLLASSGYDAIELWLLEATHCSRWTTTRKPRRFLRLADATIAQLEEVVEDCDAEREVDETTVDSPLVMDGRTVGLLRWSGRAIARTTDAAREDFNRIADFVAVSLEHHRVQLAQRERVKELTCLYGIAKAAEGPDQTTGGVLQEIVGLLPPAWQYPEIAAARIRIDQQSFETPGFRPGEIAQTSAIYIRGTRRGTVEVVYLEDRPDLDEGPFLAEERSLLDAVAREVAQIVERLEAEHDQKRLQGQLLHADRLATIGQLAAGVAHELNEPLAGVLGFAQLVAKTSDLPRQAAEDIDKIVAVSLHAREIVRKLMIFARQAPAERSLVDLNEVVRDGLYFIESRCERGGIEVVHTLSPELPEIDADQGQLHQVLVNLAVNAVQAMSEGGRLTIRTEVIADRAALVVEDTGTGMSPDVRKHIFDPFFTTKDVGEGTGLGLPVVHGIVKSHGGDVEVSSEPGKGSRFRILFPVDIRQEPNMEHHS